MKINKKQSIFFVILVFSLFMFSCVTYVPQEISVPEPEVINFNDIGEVSHFYTKYGLDTYYMYDKSTNYVTVNVVIDNISRYLSKYPKGTLDLLFYNMTWGLQGQYIGDKAYFAWAQGVIDDYDDYYTEDKIEITLFVNKNNLRNAFDVLESIVMKKPSSGDLFNSLKNLFVNKNFLYENETRNIEYYLDKLPKEIYYKNHPYGKIAQQKTDFQSIDLKSVRKLYDDIFNIHNIKFFISGSASVPMIKSVLETQFSAIPQEEQEELSNDFEIDPGDFLSLNYKTFYSTTVKGFHVTNYFPAPLRDSEYFLPFIAAMDILSSKTYMNVRIKNNLAYTLYYYMDYHKIPSGRFNMITTDLNSALEIVAGTLRNLKENGITEDDLKQFYAMSYTNFYLDVETKYGVFYYIKDSVLKFQNPHLINNYLEQLKSITVEQVNKVLKRYFDHFVWGVIAPTKADLESLNEKLLFYDVD